MPNAQGDVKANKVLEINGNHPIYAKLKAVYAEDKDKVKDYADILYAEARMIAGLSVDNPTEIADKIFTLLA